MHVRARASADARMRAAGFWWAGFGQIVVGLLELFHGNTFGCLVFATYGSLWVSLSSGWDRVYADVGVYEGAKHHKDGECMML